MGKNKVGRPAGKTNRPEKVIFSIQTTRQDFNELKNYAEEQQRSVSQMAAILLHRGLFPADC